MQFALNDDFSGGHETFDTSSMSGNTRDQGSPSSVSQPEAEFTRAPDAQEFETVFLGGTEVERFRGNGQWYFEASAIFSALGHPNPGCDAAACTDPNLGACRAAAKEQLQESSDTICLDADGEQGTAENSGRCFCTGQQARALLFDGNIVIVCCLHVTITHASFSQS